MKKKKIKRPKMIVYEVGKTKSIKEAERKEINQIRKKNLS